MPWVLIKDELPPPGGVVTVRIQHWYTKTIKEVVLKSVDESDCIFRFPDDNAELSYDWDPIEWLKAEGEGETKP